MALADMRVKRITEFDELFGPASQKSLQLCRCRSAD
jgi:hypothetical protein